MRAYHPFSLDDATRWYELTEASSFWKRSAGISKHCAHTTDDRAVSNPNFIMRPSTIEQLRAHLVLASLAAAMIQVLVLIAMLIFHVPARIFMLPSFRVGMLVAVVCIVLFIRGRSRSAFRSAVASGHVSVNGWRRRTVSMSPQCPHRLLVVFYLKLNSRLLDRTVP
jgi:hypothetical protein